MFRVYQPSTYLEQFIPLFEGSWKKLVLVVVTPACWYLMGKLVGMACKQQIQCEASVLLMATCSFITLLPDVLQNNTGLAILQSYVAQLIVIPDVGSCLSLMSSWMQGSQTGAAYTSKGLTNGLYALSFKGVELMFKLRRRKLCHRCL